MTKQEIKDLQLRAANIEKRMSEIRQSIQKDSFEKIISSETNPLYKQLQSNKKNGMEALIKISGEFGGLSIEDDEKTVKAKLARIQKMVQQLEFDERKREKETQELIIKEKDAEAKKKIEQYLEESRNVSMIAMAYSMVKETFAKEIKETEPSKNSIFSGYLNELDENFKKTKEEFIEYMDNLIKVEWNDPEKEATRSFYMSKMRNEEEFQGRSEEEIEIAAMNEYFKDNNPGVVVNGAINEENFKIFEQQKINQNADKIKDKMEENAPNFQDPTVFPPIIKQEERLEEPYIAPDGNEVTTKTKTILNFDDPDFLEQRKKEEAIQKKISEEEYQDFEPKEINLNEKFQTTMKKSFEDKKDISFSHNGETIDISNKDLMTYGDIYIENDFRKEKMREVIEDKESYIRENMETLSENEIKDLEQEITLRKVTLAEHEHFTQVANENPEMGFSQNFTEHLNNLEGQKHQNVENNKIETPENSPIDSQENDIETEPEVIIEEKEVDNKNLAPVVIPSLVPLKPFAVDMLPEYQSNLNKKTEALEGIIINEENMPKLLDNNNVKGAEIDNTPIYLQNAIELVPPSEPIKEVTHNTPALYNTELDVGNNKNGVLAYIKNEVKKLTFSETPFPNNNILALPGSSKLLPNMKKPEIPLLKAPDNMENNQENIQPDMKNKEPEHNPISDHDKKIEEPDEEKMWHQKTVNAPFDSAVNALKNFDFDNPLNSKNQEIMSNINNGIDGIMNQFNNPELVALMRASHGQKYGLSNEESRDILYGTSVGDLFRKGYEEGDRLQARDAYKNKLSEIQEQSARQGNTWSNNISEIFKMASPLNFIMPTSAAFALLKSTGTTFKMLGEAVSNKAYKNKIDEAYGARIKAELGKMGFNVTDHDAKMIAKEERKRNFGFNLKNINNNIQAWNPIMNINPFSENFGEKYDASKMLGGVFPGLKTSEHLLSPKNNKTLMKLLQGSSQGLYDDSLKLGEHKDAIDKFENIFVEKLDDKGIEYQAKKDESYTLIRSLSADELSENDKYNFIGLMRKKAEEGLTVEENESYNSFYQKLNKNTIANLDKINKSATKISAEINILKDGAEQAGIKIDDENNKIYGYTNKLNEFHEKNNGFVETAQNIGNKITGIKSGTHDLNVNDDSIGHQPDTQTKNPNVDTNLNNEAEKKPDEEQNKKPKKSKDPSPDF